MVLGRIRNFEKMAKDKLNSLRKRPSPEGTEEKSSFLNRILSFNIIKILFVTAVSFLLLVWIFQPFLNSIQDFTSTVVSEFAPNWGGLNLLPTIALIVMSFFLGWSLAYSSTKKIGGVFVLLILLGLGTNYLPTYALSPGGKLQPYVSTLLCSVQQLTKNPQRVVACQIITQQNEPQGKKIGNTKAIELDFGFESKLGLPDAVYFDRLYRTPVTIKNVDKTKVINDLTVNAFIENDKGDKINLVPNICSSASPCKLTSEETIVLASQEKITFKQGSFVDVKVTASYPQKVKGSYDFIIYRSFDDVKKTLPEPEKGPGPLDVITFTSPRVDIFESIPEGSSNSMTLTAKLVNKGSGKAFINEISFLKEFPFSGLSLKECQTDSGQTFSENNPLILRPSAELSQKKKEMIVFCDFDILKNQIEFGLGKSETSVKLDIFVDYLYEEGISIRTQVL